MKIDREKLKVIPYLNHGKIGSRVSYLGPFLNQSNKWDMWIPSTNGDLIKVQIVEPVESIYFAVHAHKSNDIYLRFFDLFMQRLNFDRSQIAMFALRSDVHNLGAIFQKLDLFSNNYKNNLYTHVELARFASTELEYYFILLRSLFDIFQEIVSVLITNSINLKTNSRFPNLPTSFSKMFIGEMGALRFNDKYHLPPEIEKVYMEYAQAFFTVREFRDLVAHRGESPDYIFPSEEGFLVKTDRTPFAKLNIWKDVPVTPTNLGPLKFAMKHFARQVFEMYEAFAVVAEGFSDLPEPTVPGYKTFIKSNNNNGLVDLLDMDLPGAFKSSDGSP